MTTDNGGAPCSYNSILTLAICKPKIRSTAEENDWIIGFGGKDLGERLIYVAQVTTKLHNGEYYKTEKYYKRPDCIYRWDSEKKDYYRVAVDENEYHKDGSNLDHDLDKRKALVLLSKNYTYFGNLGTSEYKEKYPEIRKNIEALKRSHRINHSETLFDELCRLIQEHIVLKIEGKPSDIDSCKKCNCIEGQLVVSSRKTTNCV